MGSGEDSRPIHLIQPAFCLIERMCMHSVAESQAIDRDVHLIGPEETLHQCGQDRRHAGVSGRYSGWFGVMLNGTQS